MILDLCGLHFWISRFPPCTHCLNAQPLPHKVSSMVQVCLVYLQINTQGCLCTQQCSSSDPRLEYRTPKSIHSWVHHKTPKLRREKKAQGESHQEEKITGGRCVKTFGLNFPMKIFRCKVKKKMLKICYQNHGQELSASAKLCKHSFTNHPFKAKLACPYPQRKKSTTPPEVFNGLTT